MIKLSIFFLLFSFPSVVNAYCEQANFSVFFANGMFNSREDALTSYKAYRDQFHYAERKTLSILFDRKFIAYNTDEALLNQLLEVARQKSTDVEISFWKYLSRLNQAPDWFQVLAAQIQNNIVLKEIFLNLDLQVQIDQYVKILNIPNSHIITIAHSQGNFFTNFAFMKIKASHPEFVSRINMVSVATPASEVFNDGRYTTLISDCIMAKMPGALAANLSVEKPGFCDHSFVDHYLNRPEPLEKINKDVLSEIELSSQTPDFNVPLSEDIKPFLLFEDQLKKMKYPHVFAPHQCFAFRLSYSLRNLYWQNITCSDRGLIGLTRAAKQCLETSQNKESNSGTYLCPNYFGKEPNSFNDSMGQLFRESDIGFLYEHPECDWSKEVFFKKIISPELVDKTIQFLKRPWSEIDLNNTSQENT